MKKIILLFCFVSGFLSAAAGPSRDAMKVTTRRLFQLESAQLNPGELEQLEAFVPNMLLAVDQAATMEEKIVASDRQLQEMAIFKQAHGTSVDAKRITQEMILFSTDVIALLYNRDQKSEEWPLVFEYSLDYYLALIGEGEENFVMHDNNRSSG